MLSAFSLPNECLNGKGDVTEGSRGYRHSAWLRGAEGVARPGSRSPSSSMEEGWVVVLLLR